MTTIDWNDPEFCKKYKYHDGTAIVDIHVLPDWSGTHFPVLLLLADGRTDAITANNTSWPDVCGGDCVVPARREPRPQTSCRSKSSGRR